MPPKQKNGKKILIIDGESMTYKTLKEILEYEGYVAITAQNGRDAIKICKEDSSIDFVTTGFRLAYYNGIEVAKKIKEMRPDIPIVLISGIELKEISARPEYDESLFAGYINKPMNLKPLLSTIKKTIRLRK